MLLQRQDIEAALIVQASQFKLRSQDDYLPPQRVAWNILDDRVVLIKALQDAGSGQWFRVVEREGLDNLLRERQIIRETRALYQPGADGSLPPLLFAGLVLEGGIIGYDTNTATGGFGARLLGIGGSTEYRMDTVTVHLRAVSISTSEVLIAVEVSKTLFSIGVGADVFRFVSSDEILEIDAGLTQSEPEFVATKQAIEKAVIALILTGVERGVFAFSEENAETRALLEAHRRERGEAPPEHAGLTAPSAASEHAAAELGRAGVGAPAAAGRPVAAADPAAASPDGNGGDPEGRVTAESMPDATPESAGPRPVVRIRSGRHATFSRLVFDRPEPFDYAVVRDGATVRIHFEAPAAADGSRVRAQHLRWLTGIVAAADEENLTVTLDIDPQATVRHTALDHRVVVDLIPARYRALPLWDSQLLPPAPDEPAEAVAVAVDG